METILYVVIAMGVLLVIIGLAGGKKGQRRHGSDSDSSDSWDSDSDGGSDSGCGSDGGCGGGCGGGD